MRSAATAALAGAYTERTSRRTRECVPSTLLFHPAGEEQEDRFGAAGGRIFHVELPARIVDGARDIGLELDRALPEVGEARWIVRRTQQELQAWDSASPLAIEGLALQLVGELARSTRAERREPSWLARAGTCRMRDFANRSRSTTSRMQSAFIAHSSREGSAAIADARSATTCAGCGSSPRATCSRRRPRRSRSSRSSSDSRTTALHAPVPPLHAHHADGLSPAALTFKGVTGVQALSRTFHYRPDVRLRVLLL